MMVVNQFLVDFAHNISLMDYTEEDETLIEQSRQAYLDYARQNQQLDLEDVV